MTLIAGRPRNDREQKDQRQVKVLQSFPSPRPHSNPYTELLSRSLRELPGVTVVNFSWAEALMGRYDVFHVHWPEILVDGRSPAKKSVRQLLTVMLLVKLCCKAIPVVRTVHNVGLPEGISRREKFLLHVIERRTALCIRLNSQTEVSRRLPVVTVPHGDYRSWYAQHPTRRAVPGQFGYVGLVRRYKGVESLVGAFVAAAGDHPQLTLRVGGRPSTAALAATIEDLAGDDPRVELDLRQLSDGELVDIVTSSELVVLPYRFMHNSAGALTVLSLGRPVLMPDNEVNRCLREEVGPGWVYLYRGDLASETLVGALQSVRSDVRSPEPDLSNRGWDETGRLHLDAYRRVLS
ncbi:glycosyl transferase [Pseudarthrobacter sp. PvP090]|uniref:glycosyl transferase n=1 Tax=Pseudarthrobacter sp. PvP090 TaxID=3156393 RepID=UPI003395C5D6